MRQRMNPAVLRVPKDYRGWLLLITNPKIEISNLNYLISIRDPAKSGMGQRDNRHLNYFGESINRNVGGFYQDVKVSSPPMTDRSVGGAVVVGVRESRVHGEGRQSVGKPAKTNRMSTG